MIRHIILSLAIASVAVPTLAHERTSATTPEAGSTVTEVEMLHIAFSGPMRITYAELTRDGEAVAITREAGLEPVEALHATPDVALAPGQYLLEWRGLAADGHPMQGDLAFTVSD